jgi:hypothetical protein
LHHAWAFLARYSTNANLNWFHHLDLNTELFFQFFSPLFSWMPSFYYYLNAKGKYECNRLIIYIIMYA